MSVFCTAYIIKMAATCIGVVFLIFMGFSRVYLGAHSYNQVVFGTTLGAAFAIIGHYKIKPIFLALPELLYTDQGGSKYNVTPMSYLKTLTIGFIMPMILAGFVMLMNSDRAFYHSNEWRYRQTNAGCVPEELVDYNMLHYLHFTRGGIIALACGSFLGQQFEYRVFVNTGVMNTSAWLWYRTSPVKTVLRILLTTALLSTSLMPMFFAERMEDMVSDDSYFGKALVGSIFFFMIPYFMASFIAFGLLRYFFYKVKLDNQEGHRLEFQTREQYLKSIGLELDLSGPR